MTTLASPPKPSRATRPFTCSFVSINVAINDVRYAVDPIPAGEDGTKAFRLAKHSGDHEVYDVIRTHSGVVECSCPDYIARHQGNGYGTCKHGRALCELGLMPAPIAPAPVVAPVVLDECDLAEFEDAGPPESWPADTDNWFWSPGDDADGDVNSELLEGVREAEASRPTLTLADLADMQAACFRSWPTLAGEVFARAFDEIALVARMTGSETAADYIARKDVLESDARAQWEAIGYEQGKASCPCHDHAGGTAFGHSA